jgi:hypothetical protein
VDEVAPAGYSDVRRLLTEELIERIALCCLLVVCFVPAFAQKQTPSPAVTDADFEWVVVAVSNQDWDTAVSLSAKFTKHEG